jgi:DNA invertase Pin-like site-specific DNA recombinase
VRCAERLYVFYPSDLADFTSCRKKPALPMLRKSQPVGLPLAIYARVSRESQASGWSLDTQVDLCKRSPAVQNSPVEPLVFVDIATAANLIRPGLSALLNARNEFSHTVVYKLDRLTRSVRDWLHLTDLLHGPRNGENCTILSVSESIDLASSYGRFTALILVAVGELERERIAERTSDAIAHAHGRKTYLGLLPMIQAMRNQGGKSLRFIARAASEATGQHIAHTTVKYLLDKIEKP